MPIDPTADLGRRAWLPCPVCADDDACADCLAGRNCGRHWQYLLSSHATRIFLQCPSCGHLWHVDTRRRCGCGRCGGCAEVRRGDAGN